MIARIRQALLALLMFLYGARRRRRAARESRRAASANGRGGRIVPAGAPDRRAENVVIALLLIAALFAAGFIFLYAWYSPARSPNQLLGVAIAGSLGFVALALAVFARRLIVTEELEEDYPRESPAEQREIAQLVRDSGSRLTRRRLLLGAAGTTGGALGAAALTPALSLGPLWDTSPLFASPWRSGRRLVDAHDRPMLASEVEPETLYTAFPEGANPEELASPLAVIRLQPSELRLPAGRAGWAPQGILAYSKICTHAGCAVGLYRKPRFPAVEPGPALVCPCHYSTFDPATGATVIFGPAGRPLPQLPLTIDGEGHLRAAGRYSGPVGPGWWGVRSGEVK
ncbi:MAG TPA: Rieske 2Fe-2S domain-containing protein [Solirubrobacteraceae bacterium]|nr:Rieske 2Fe-2S domain-containing protein [Solirubrobacteraceae bacterium]